jgi:phosphatidate cytidylyltransferase
MLFESAVILGCASIGANVLPHAGLIVLGGAVVFWTMIAPRWMFRSSAVSPLVSAVAGWLVLVSAWQAVFLLQVTPVRLLALLGVVWIADTAAYFAGRQFGRHKLAPAISPGKTWEGAFGAGIAVGVYYWLLWWVIAPVSLAAVPALDGVLVAAMLVLSVEGDLFESWMKRRAGVKDSGTVLPGHGGVLDRIDGVIAALPLAASLPLLARG